MKISKMLILLLSANFCYASETVQELNSEQKLIINNIQNDSFFSGRNKIITENSNKKNQDPITLTCYKNGLCLVKEIRFIPVIAGINKTNFQGLFNGLIKESLNFRSLKRGKLIVLDYKFNDIFPSKHNLYVSSVGDTVFFRLDHQKVEKGKLLRVSKEKNGTFVVIEAENKCFVIPIACCIAIDNKICRRLENNSVDVTFESKIADNSEVEISYLTKNIHWEHLCIIDVGEKLDKVDIYSKALLINNSGYDLKNVNVIFNTTSPNFDRVLQTKNVILEPEHNVSKKHTYSQNNLSIGKNESMVCMLKSAKEISPKLEYMVKIPSFVFEEAFSGAKNISVGNLLIIEDAKNLELGQDLQDTEALIFKREDEKMNFLGKQTLSSLKKNKDIVFEIGKTPDIEAKVEQTDVRKLSEQQSEFAVRVYLKNYKKTEVTANVVADIKSAWSIAKKRTDMRQTLEPSWCIKLKPEESKELHFRIKVVTRKK